MNQSQLAKRINVDRSFISMVFSGKREPSKILARELANAVPGTRMLDWLFSRQNLKKLIAAVRRAK